MGYGGFVLEPHEVVALPLDELALRVLADVVALNEWNWRNWMRGAEQGGFCQETEALQALGEAWNWLVSRGLIMLYNPGQSSESAITVTRRGREALKNGLPWLQAVVRLDIDLVPALEQKARPQFLRGDFETAAFLAREG